MSKKTGGILAFIGLLGLSVFLLSCGTKVSRSSGLLFVVSQGSNQVSSYAIDQNTGNLSYPKTGASTCATAPCGFPLDILLDPTNATAFVLNQGVPSSGEFHRIYAYTLNSDGSLTGVGDVTSALSVFAPGDMAVAMTRDAGGKFLSIVTQGNPKLVVLGTTPGSTSLSLVGQTALTRIPTSVSAITFTPSGSTTAETLLYITSNKDLIGTNDNTVSEYSVDSSGNVAEKTGSPYVTGAAPSAVLAVDTNPAGEHRRTVCLCHRPEHRQQRERIPGVHRAERELHLQNVQDATMSAVGSPVPVGQAPIALAADPTNNFLYVACETSNQVYAFRISTATGVLSGLNPAFLSTGSLPVAMALHPTGTFLYLYVSNNASSNLSGFVVNTTSGQLGNPITVISLGQPAGLVAK